MKSASWSAFHKLALKTAACIALCSFGPVSVRASDSIVLTFEEFLPQLPDQDFINLWEGTPYQGVVFEFAAVARDTLVANSQHASDYWVTDGTGRFVGPHSGHVALFNPVGARLVFSAEQTLTGLWVTKANLGPAPGAERLTLTAYDGETPLVSLSRDLNSDPWFWDTSLLLLLPRITKYSIDPEFPGNETGYFVVDDMQFSPSLEEVCPCGAAWPSGGAYRKCVRRFVSVLVEDGTLTQEEAKEILKAALHSECGRN